MSVVMNKRGRVGDRVQVRDGGGWGSGNGHTLALQRQSRCPPTASMACQPRPARAWGDGHATAASQRAVTAGMIPTAMHACMSGRAADPAVPTHSCRTLTVYASTCCRPDMSASPWICQSVLTEVLTEQANLTVAICKAISHLTPSINRLPSIA